MYNIEINIKNISEVMKLSLQFIRKTFVLSAIIMLFSCTDSQEQSSNIEESSESTVSEVPSSIASQSDNDLEKSLINLEFLNHAKLEEPAVLLFGVEGAKPIGFLKICWDGVLTNRSKYAFTRYENFIQEGGVGLMQATASLGDVFICQIAHNKYQPLYTMFEFTNMIDVDGPGIYYLGTIRTREVYEIGEVYLPEITPLVKDQVEQMVIKVQSHYAELNLKPINFDLNKVQDDGTIEVLNRGHALTLMKEDLEMNADIKPKDSVEDEITNS